MAKGTSKGDYTNMENSLPEQNKNANPSRRKSLNFRMRLILVGLSLFIGIVMMIFLSIIYQNRIESEYTNKAIMLSKIAASMMDGEDIDRYLLTLEKDDAYYRIFRQLQLSQQESGVTYVYISRIDGLNEIIVFDAELDLGSVISIADEQYDNILAATQSGKLIEPYIYDTKWGSLFTAIEPIYRKDGSVSGYANAAIALEQIITERIFIFTLLGVIILLTSLAFATAGFYAVQRIVLSPVRDLTNSISAYHPGETLPDLFNPEKSTPKTHSSNEIDILERSLTQMTARTDKMFAEVKQLEAVRLANRAKSDFLARMSHEIRTPMNVIVGISQMQLHKNGLSQESEQAWNHVYEAGNNLLAIINDILDMSKIETGKMALELSSYSLPSLINDVVTLSIVRIGSKPIELRLDIAEDLPLKMRGDEVRLKEILTNLLSNAIKYTDAGSVKISANHFLQNGALMLRFVVEDTGQGIKPEDMPNLFTEFMRFNASTTRYIEGTGLGLSITKSLVEMMGGTIKAESEYGVGSKFTVTVMQESVNGEVIGKELSKRLSNFTFNIDRRFQNKRIVRYPMPYGKVLIVDDVRSNLFVAQGLLLPYELQIETAVSGYEAIEKISAGSTYDVIFMDHMMPQMDGIETTNKLREIGYKGTIIALTANALVGNEEMFIQNGFDDFIPKPIDIRHLNTVLNKYVRDKYPKEAAKYKMTSSEEPSGESPEVDRKLLELFLRDAQRGEANLKKALANDDMKLYIIAVHAMKSALANISKDELSKSAAALENAGRTGDTAFIKANHENFMTSLRALIDSLTALGDASDGGAAIDTQIQEDTPFLSKELLVIKKACEDYDDAAAFTALGRLREKQWKRETSAALKEIYDILFIDSNFENAAERVVKLMKS
ncbi:MAG: ATP-binding protein [Oscillospiraceae bacterium]|nr:ATP-binding protein [Oscillospiraceae bacterium]